MEHYICPLCLNTFNLSELGDKVNDILTVEDVPPKSLGGNPILITCRNCNSKCGHNLDVYLLNEIRYIEEKMDFSKSKTAILSCNGTKVRAKMIQLQNNSFKIDISKDNNPQHLEEFIQKVKESGDDWKINANVKLFENKRKPEVVEIAILKSAYLLAFKKLGYRYILNKNLNSIREQIKNPDKNILEKVFVIGNNEILPKEIPDGVFLACVNNRKCIVVILSFQLSSNTIKHQVAVVLPDSDDKECLIYKEILKRERNNKGSIHIKILGPATIVIHNKRENTHN